MTANKTQKKEGAYFRASKKLLYAKEYLATTQ